MIFDMLENAGKYYKLSHKLRQGLEFLHSTDFSTLTDGKIEIVDGVYANIQTYKTKPLEEGKFEAHRDYIDIQYVAQGSERVGITTYTDCKTLIPYDAERDIEFLSLKTTRPPEMIELKSGRFVILFPDDAHMPSLLNKNSEIVKKIVVKVKL